MFKHFVSLDLSELVPNGQGLQFLLTLTPWIGVAAIYCKTPSFYDEFAIRREMKRIMVLNGILYAVFVALVIGILLVSASATSDTATNATATVLEAVAFHILAAILFAVGHSMTFWVLQTVDVGFDANGRPLRAPPSAWGPRSKHPQLRSDYRFALIFGSSGH